MLDIVKTAVVVIDIQGKLAEAMAEKEAVFRNVGRIIAGARALDVPVIYSEQYPERLGETIPEIREQLHDCPRISKRSFSCWGEAAFRDALTATGRTQILLTGIETHVCVFQTAVELITHGFEVHVVADAVASRKSEDKRIALARLAQEAAVISCTEMALFELLKVASGDNFKTVLKLVR